MFHEVFGEAFAAMGPDEPVQGVTRLPPTTPVIGSGDMAVLVEAARNKPVTVAGQPLTTHSPIKDSYILLGGVLGGAALIWWLNRR